jgi:hypothetical protein
MEINWGLLQGESIPNALNTGIALGQRNALLRRDMDQQDEALQLRRAEGARAERSAARTERSELTEQNQRDVEIAGIVLDQVNPTDQATYDRALAAYQQAGGDMADVPRQYDPNFIAQARDAARSLAEFRRRQQRQQGANAPNLQREVEYYRSIGRNDLAETLLRRNAEGGPQVIRNDDNTLTIVPPSMYYGGNGAGTASPPAPQDEAGLRAAAEEAIRQGADPVQVNQRLEQMLGGGAGPAGPQTFPGQ